MRSNRRWIRPNARLALFFALALPAAIAAVAAWSATASKSDLAHRPGSLLRLHVVAHSNAPRDQDAKLAVRDALIQEMVKWPPQSSAEDMERWIGDQEETLADIARRTLEARGFSLPVRVDVGDFFFPEKTAGRTTLPEGRYRAVKVVIGDGAGHNWWCVLFPPLCFVEEDGEVVPVEDERRGPSLLSIGVAEAADAPGEPSDDAAPSEAEAQEGTNVQWRLRLWSQLSENAYSKLREIVHVSLASLRPDPSK